MVKARVLYWALIAFGLAMKQTACAQPAFDAAKLTSNIALLGMDQASLRKVGLERVKAGELLLPDGKLVAMDPLVMPERPPFTQQVPTGNHTVEVIRRIGIDDRTAMLIIEFAPGKPVRWELGLIPGQDIGTLKADDFFGIPVDAGVAAFASSRFFAAFKDREKLEKAKNRRYSNYYDDVLALEMKDRQFVRHEPISGRAEAAALVTSSGWGDGYYPTIFGFDDRGQLALVFIDFFVAENADGRDEWDKKRDQAIAAMTEQERHYSPFAYGAMLADDIKTLREHLEKGHVTADTYHVESAASLMFEAIRLDKPSAVAVFIASGARDRLPDFARFGDVATYSGYAQNLMQTHQKEQRGEQQPPSGVPPLAARSPELLRLMATLATRP